MFSSKAVLSAAVVSAAALFSGGSQAAIGDTYEATFQGVTFTFVQLDADTLTFELSGSLPLAPDWDTATQFAAFDLKDLGLDFGGNPNSNPPVPAATGTAFGPGTPITGLLGLNAQLSTSSPDCVSQGTPPGGICFDIADQDLTDPFDFLYTINFSSALNISSSGPHLQVLFLDADGKKAGSLYSQNVGICEECGGPPTEIPEPGSLALIGLGLGFAGYIGSRRRKKL